MSILLMGECWPYRGLAGSWDNSQCRLLAKTCGTTTEQLQTVCECRFAIRKYVPSCNKDARFERLLSERLQTIFSKNQYDLILLIGLRMGQLLGFKDIGFFDIHFTTNPTQMFACIPNPLAEYWWKEDSNLRKVHKFMSAVLLRYGQ